MDEDRLDFSPLDPMRDAARWRDVLDATIARVEAVLEERDRRADAWGMIASWSRPLLAAAVLAAVVLLSAIGAMRQAGSASPTQARPAGGLTGLTQAWAAGGSEPTGKQLLLAVERRGER